MRPEQTIAFEEVETIVRDAYAETGYRVVVSFIKKRKVLPQFF
jgi:hypothetical protein